MKGVVLKPRSDVEIQPATAEQVIKAGEHWVVIEADLGGVVQELKEISPLLHLRYNPHQKFYAIYAREKGQEYLVGTYTHLDKRITQRIRKIMDSSYNFVEESEKKDKEAKDNWEYAWGQKIAENAEKLAWAIRKDLGLNKDTAFIKDRNG